MNDMNLNDIENLILEKIIQVEFRKEKMALPILYNDLDSVSSEIIDEYFFKLIDEGILKVHSFLHFWVSISDEFKSTEKYKKIYELMKNNEY